jgi:cell wall-associated NlpC family hydrolase
MPEPTAIIGEARRWIGVRWCHQGRDRQRGVDCAGLLIRVADHFNLGLIDRRAYGRRQDGRYLVRDLHQQLKYISLSLYKGGDIGLFTDQGFPLHVGFLTGPDQGDGVIHAHARRRQVVEEPLAQFGRPVAIFRLPEVR